MATSSRAFSPEKGVTDFALDVSIRLLDMLAARKFIGHEET
jgi:hypothetical protein